jgi:hypothetical protein
MGYLFVAVASPDATKHNVVFHHMGILRRHKKVDEGAV